MGVLSKDPNTSLRKAVGSTVEIATWKEDDDDDDDDSNHASGAVVVDDDNRDIVAELAAADADPNGDANGSVVKGVIAMNDAPKGRVNTNSWSTTRSLDMLSRWNWNCGCI